MGKHLRSLFFLIAFFTWITGLKANCPNINTAFTPSVLNICGPGPVTVNFVNNSTGAGAAGATYNWYLNGVLFDNTTGLVAPGGSTISAVGTYTFMLVAVDASVPCMDTAVQTVVIHPIPNAGFTFNPNNQCAGNPVVFTNTSTGTTTGTTYGWNFGDATTSTQQNPSHTYAAGGTYIVTLIVTNFTGCTSTYTLSVTALNIPAVNISGDDGDGDTQYCLLPGDPTTSETVVFSNFTTGGVSYTWNFGDGSPTLTTGSTANVSHTYTSYGTYLVTMTATGPNGCTAVDSLTVIFERYVGASFSVPINQMSGCLPLTLTPVNASQNATMYVWNFGDGSPLVTTTSPVPPTHTYTVAGTYTITLVASNSCNSSTSTVSPIVVVGAPIVNFNATPTPGCSPQVVNFQNTSTGVSPANNYTWNFGNGNVISGTANPPPQTYGQGTYTIQLIAGSACGTDTMIRIITVDTIPDVNLTVNPTNGCTPLVVTSNNTSTGGALTYQWYIDGVFYSSAQNIPPQTFTAPPGNNAVNHSIHLYVINHCGTRDSTVNILVHPAVQAVFAPLTSTICAGQTVTFTQASFGDSLTYAWDFGNGNTSTTAGPHTQTYNTPGTYTVSLIVDGYCGIDTLTSVVTVNPIPTALITPGVSQGCEDLTVNFTNGSTAGGTYSWNFGTGTPGTSTAFTPPPVTFTNPGNHMVTLNVSVLGCTANDTVYIDVFPQPLPAFTAAPTTGCSPLNVTFNNTTANPPGNVYSWDFGNGNTSSAQNPPGQAYIAAANDSTYTVELVVTNADGCADSITIPILVHPLPVASFTMSADTVCALDNVIFTNTSTGISVYSWNFGDAGTSSTTSPVHAYANAGSYTVTLIATTAFGCMDTTTGVVMVDSIPNAAFTSTVECIGDSTVFTNNSTGSVSTWQWNFGDASTGTSQSPSHLYSAPGTYNVTLTATNFAGCSHFVTQPVIVNLVPVAAFATTTVCEGQATAFTDQTSGTPISWNWDFGDATPAGTAQNPAHSYAVAGTYTATLIAAAGSGCADTTSATVTVNPIPTAAFTHVSVCANDTTFFNSTSLGAPNTFFWDFGDGNTDNTNNPAPSHIYVNGGSYNVTLTAGYAATGCTHSIVIPVTVFPRTVPSFTSNVPCLGGATNFSDATTNAPTTWTWNFGDGSPTDATQNPAHTYTAPGIYPVTLITQNTFGCVDSITTNVQVYPLPVADFSADTVCEGYTSAFSDSSISASAWSWDFGDATPAGTAQHPTHVYLSQGTYNVTLIVTSPNGCFDTITQPVIVNPNPVSAFSASMACHTYSTLYTDNSTSAVSWSWDFGDGSPLSTNTSPSYIFANPGTYNSTLIVTNVFGCTDTSTQAVTVLPQPQAGFVSNVVCAMQAVQFNDTTTGLPTTWSWDFGDGSPLDASQNPSHTYTVGGSYAITLIAGNAAGCIDTLQTNITVNTVPTPAFNATAVCLGNVTNFTDQSVDPTPLASWYWDFGDGNNSFAQNPNYIYQNPGTYNVMMIVTNTSGCTDTVMNTVNVSAIPVAAFSADTVCVGSATSFTDLSTGPPNTWLWDFGDGNTSSTGPNVQHTYANAGTFLASVIVSGGNGCTDQIFVPVTVSNTVQAAMSVAPSSCLNEVLAFTDNSVITSGTISSWSWDFGDGSPADPSQHTSHVYASPGSYTVTLTVAASSGCVSVTTQPVTVNPLPQAAFASTTACANQPTAFTDNSTGGATSWQWDFGDGNTSTQQNPAHQYASSGAFNTTLIAATAAGCADTIVNQVIVYSQPVAIFSADTVCFGDTTKFSDLSTTTDGSIVSWNWNFTDGTSTQTNPSHNFTTVNDSFYVTLIVQTSFGCIDTVTQLVITHPIPNMNFGPLAASGCEDFTAQFSDLSTVNGGSIVNWLWDFGDGNFSYAQNPSHTYDDPGSFYVALTVTSTNGCVFTDSLLYPVIVYPKPVAEFDPSPNSTSILTPEISFADLSQGAMYWEWDFGDFESSLLQNPSHVYPDSGTYMVTQIVINQYGCRDTVSYPVRIEAEFTYFIPNAFTPNGDGDNDLFFGKGIGIDEFKMYLFDRWGNLIFEADDPSQGWDGKLASGVEAQMDVYVWKVIIRDVLGEEHTMRGHVSLVR